MRAVILAAGRGSRLASGADAPPKCLTELGGQTLLARTCATLRRAGVDELAVVTGYRAEAITGVGLHRFHAPRWAETQMVQSLAAAAPWLDAAPCLVAYGDIFFPTSAARALAAADAPLAIAYDPAWRALWSARFARPLDDAERFRLGPGGDVIEIGGRPGSLDEVEGQYMGLLRFTPDGWRAAAALVAGLPPAAADRIDLTSLLQRLIAGGVRVAAVPCHEPWGEIDCPTDLALYAGWLADSRLVLEPGGG